MYQGRNNLWDSGSRGPTRGVLPLSVVARGKTPEPKEKASYLLSDETLPGVERPFSDLSCRSYIREVTRRVP